MRGLGGRAVAPVTSLVARATARTAAVASQAPEPERAASDMPLIRLEGISRVFYGDADEPSSEPGPDETPDRDSLLVAYGENGLARQNIGLSSGTVTWRNCCHRVAPSTLAAS